MLPGTGIIWLSGEGERLFPYFAPEYRDRPEIFPALIDPNPYHDAAAWWGSAAPTSSPSPAAPFEYSRAAKLFLWLVMHLPKWLRRALSENNPEEFLASVKRFMVVLSPPPKPPKPPAPPRSLRRKILNGVASFGFGCVVFWLSVSVLGYSPVRSVGPWVASMSLRCWPMSLPLRDHHQARRSMREKPIGTIGLRGSTARAASCGPGSIFGPRSATIRSAARPRAGRPCRAIFRLSFSTAARRPINFCRLSIAAA